MGDPGHCQGAVHQAQTSLLQRSRWASQTLTRGADHKITLASSPNFKSSLRSDHLRNPPTVMAKEGWSLIRGRSTWTTFCCITGQVRTEGNTVLHYFLHYWVTAQYLLSQPMVNLDQLSMVNMLVQWALVSKCSFTSVCLSQLLSVSVQLSFTIMCLSLLLSVSVHLSFTRECLSLLLSVSVWLSFTRQFLSLLLSVSVQLSFTRVLVTILVSKCSAVIHKRVLVTIPQRFAVTGCTSCTVYSHTAHWEVSYDFSIIHHLGLAFLRVNNTWLACQVTPITGHCGFWWTVPSYRWVINRVPLVLTLLVE